MSLHRVMAAAQTVERKHIATGQSPEPDADSLSMSSGNGASLLVIARPGCGYCVRELDALRPLIDALKTRNFTVLIIDSRTMQLAVPHNVFYFNGEVATVRGALPESIMSELKALIASAPGASTPMALTGGAGTPMALMASTGTPEDETPASRVRDFTSQLWSRFTEVLQSNTTIWERFGPAAAANVSIQWATCKVFGSDRRDPGNPERVEVFIVLFNNSTKCMLRVFGTMYAKVPGMSDRLHAKLSCKQVNLHLLRDVIADTHPQQADLPQSESLRGLISQLYSRAKPRM